LPLVADVTTTTSPTPATTTTTTTTKKDTPPTIAESSKYEEKQTSTSTSKPHYLQSTNMQQLEEKLATKLNRLDEVIGTLGRQQNSIAWMKSSAL